MDNTEPLLANATAPTDDPAEARLVEAAVATSLGDTVLPHPEELWLSHFRDATLLVLAVVAHAHGASAKDVRRATGQWLGAVQLSLRNLQRASLIKRQYRAGPDYWFATHEGTRLGVTPYVTRLLGAIQPFWRGRRGPWSVGRFSSVGTTAGPPIFSPAYELADVTDPQVLANAIRTGTHDDRAYAVTKLVALNDPASVPVLREVAQRSGKEELLARQAVVALGSFNSPEAIDVLIEIAGHRDSILREAAAHALGRLHSSEAIPTLIELIRYPGEAVRAAALNALAEIDDRSTAPAIATALSDSHHSVRRCAREALIELGGVEQLRSNPSRPSVLRTIDARRAQAHATLRKP